MSIEIALIISGISVAFGIYQGIATLKRNTKEDNKRDASVMTTVIVKLENISAGISEIKSDMVNVKGDLKELTERVIVTEQSTKQAHRRLDDIKTTNRKDKEQ